MSKLNITIDYIKVAQWFKQIQYYQRRIKNELDKACVEAGHEITGEDMGLPESAWSEGARNGTPYKGGT